MRDEPRVCPVCGTRLDTTGRCPYRTDHLYEEYGLEI